MKLSDKMLDALNTQLNNEFSAAYVYLAMSAWLEKENYPGFAKWMRMQTQEELLHALKLYDFIINCNGLIALKEVKACTKSWTSVADIFADSLQHEETQTQRIYDLNKIAIEEGAFAVQAELQWFITEQVEEEASIGAIVDQLNMVQDNRAALLMLDRELSSRAVPAPPEPTV